LPESPWSVKRGKQPAVKPFTPEGAQVKHIPHHHPPKTEPRRRARHKPPRKPIFRQPEPRHQPAARGKRAARSRQSQKSLSAVTLTFFGVLALALVVLSVLFIQQENRLKTLQGEREQARVQQENKVKNHLIRRAESGYQGLIDSYAAEYQINPAFVAAVIKCESNFLPKAVSSADARGLMQIMPDTGVWLAGRLGTPNYTIERLFEPQLNIQYGAYYLSYLSSHFGGQPVMVAAAYHAGLNNVKLWALKYAADKKTLRLDQLPMSNTRDYVGKVMDAYAIYYEQDQLAKGAVPGAVPDAALLLGAGQ
jgi:soluble lytic murein transglycosylase